MGMTRQTRPPAGIADALFSASQQRVLAQIFGQPDRSFYASELIRIARGGSGAVQRELQKLEQSGLVKTNRVGNQKHYQANPDAPLFDELTSIVRKTFGMAEPLRRALRPLSKDIVAAFVFGSVAKGRDRSASDIDLLVVSDRLAYADVYSALEPLRHELGREINPTMYSQGDFARKRRLGNSFLKRVLEQPKIWIVGDEAASPRQRGKLGELPVQKP